MVSRDISGRLSIVMVSRSPFFLYSVSYAFVLKEAVSIFSESPLGHGCFVLFLLTSPTIFCKSVGYSLPVKTNDVPAVNSQETRTNVKNHLFKVAWLSFTPFFFCYFITEAEIFPVLRVRTK